MTANSTQSATKDSYGLVLAFAFVACGAIVVELHGLLLSAYLCCIG
jgi:hypothetical protein